MDQVPFSIKRVYWLTGVVSGAWREGTPTVASGSCSWLSRGALPWYQMGGGPSLGILDKPPDGLLMPPPHVARTASVFRQNAVALVLSSGSMRESEYVRSRDEFDALIGRRS